MKFSNKASPNRPEVDAESRKSSLAMVFIDSDCPRGYRPPHDPSVELDRPVVSPAVRAWCFGAMVTVALVWWVCR